MTTVAVSATTAAAPDAPPPRQLACLEKHYGVKAVLRDGQWFATLPDGTTHVWDDGRAKSFDEKLSAPDLEDTFSIPYRAGKLRPVTTQNEDPGRIRFDPLFRAVYGHDANAVEAKLVPVTLHGQTLRVHERVKPAFERLALRLSALVIQQPGAKPYLEALGGTFNWRTIAQTQRLSPHAYGMTLDINVKRSHYWEWQKSKGRVQWQNSVPQAVVDAFEAEGFIWGGRWYHYDTMHFEYRPELLDPACAA